MNNKAFLLAGDLGKKVYKEYSTLVDEQFGRDGSFKFPSGKKYDIMMNNDGTVRGCGSFAVSLIDKVLEHYALKTVDLYDLQAITTLDNSASQALRGMHLNLGVVIIGDKKFDFKREDPYHKGTKQLKQDLKDQLTEQGYPLTDPVYIPFSSLELERDVNSPFGLRFKIVNISQLQSLELLKGDSSSRVLENAVIHVRKVKQQGLYDFKFFANTVGLSLTSIDDAFKPHHNLGLYEFDKISHSYGRILVVPKNDDRYSKTLPSIFKHD